MTKMCLVVDDSRVIRRIARQILELMSYEVVEAADGQEALARCAERDPDVILLDWNMPVMGGMEFLDAYKNGGPSNTAKVIFCTTENAMQQIGEAMSAGADEYIMKPFDRLTLQNKLEIIGCYP